jgi:hypothetical protein
VPGCSKSTSACPRRPPSASSSTSGSRLKLGYYTGAVFEVYDSALGAPDRRRRALRRPARPLRPPAAGGRLGAQRRAPAPRRGRREGAARMGLKGTHLRRPARDDARRRARPARLDRDDTSEVRANDRKLLFATSAS